MGHVKCVQSDQWLECTPVLREDGQLVVKLTNGRLVIVHEDDYEEELSEEQWDEIRVHNMHIWLRDHNYHSKLPNALVKLGITTEQLTQVYKQLE